MQHLKFFSQHSWNRDKIGFRKRHTHLLWISGLEGREVTQCSVTAFLVIQERADWKIPRFLCYFLYLMEATYTRKDLFDSKSEGSVCVLGQRFLAEVTYSGPRFPVDRMQRVDAATQLAFSFALFFPRVSNLRDYITSWPTFKVSLSPQLILSKTTTMNILRMWHQIPRRFQIQSSWQWGWTTYPSVHPLTHWSAI